MFIRWKSRQLKPRQTTMLSRKLRRGDNTVRMYCQLVESYRDEGKPRQRVIARMGSLLDQDIVRYSEDSANISERFISFWVTAYEVLDGLVEAGTITKRESNEYAKKIRTRAGDVTRAKVPAMIRAIEKQYAKRADSRERFHRALREKGITKSFFGK